MRRTPVVMILALYAVAPGALAAEPEVPAALLRVAPADTLALVLLAESRTAAAGRSTGVTLGGMAQRLRDMGILRRDGSLLWVDVLRALGLSRRWPTAWILQDIRLQPLAGGGSRLAGLTASVVVHDGGDHGVISEYIRLFLRNHTSEQSTRLESWDLQGQTFYRLIDERLPPWAVFEWGPLEDAYVVSVGRGASDRLVTAASEEGLRHEPFFSSAWPKLRAERGAATVYVDLPALEAALQGAAARVAAVRRALGVARAEALMWSLSLDGRAVIIRQVLRESGRDHVLELSRPTAAVEALIPSEATWFAGLQVDGSTVVRAGRDAYLAWHRPATRQRLAEAWDRLARDGQVDFERDVLAQLGDQVIVHNAPPHPLGVPAMITVLIEVRGDAQQLAGSLDTIFEHLSVHLEAAALRCSSFFAPHLRRTADGVWYTQAGILGPALAVTPRHVVISYSLPAVQQILEQLPGRARPGAGHDPTAGD